VSAEVFDRNLSSKFFREARIDLAPDSVSRALVIPAIADDLTTTYFLRLALEDPAGKQVSTNFYWLSTRDDELDWEKTEWYYTPVRSHADLRELEDLPPTKLRVSKRFEDTGKEGVAFVELENTGSALAFQVRLKILDPANGEEILPVFWDDNYVALFPGEKREMRAAYPRRDGLAVPDVEVEAWNVSKLRR
jgi:exo-1,4-beta-D-glucosaminidase